MLSRPHIYEYLNYRDFIRDFVEHMKSQGLYTNRKFAKESGVKSSSFVRLVVKGERNLTDEMATRIANGFGLKMRERNFFYLLVQFNQSKDIEEKDEIYQKIISSQSFEKSQEVAVLQYEVYSDWYNMIVLEAIDTQWSKQSEEDMAKSLGIRPLQLRRSIQSLESLGLIKKTKKSWKKTHQIMETPHETENLMVRNFHKEMLKKALNTVDELTPNERAFASITIALPKAVEKEVRQKLMTYIQKLNRDYSSVKKPEAVYQLNVQLFPVLKLD